MRSPSTAATKLCDVSSQPVTARAVRRCWTRRLAAVLASGALLLTSACAAGQVAQISFHLNRAMDNGLTRSEASEVLTHLAFYAGWPNAMSAVPLAKGVFDERPSDEGQ